MPVSKRIRLVCSGGPLSIVLASMLVLNTPLRGQESTDGEGSQVESDEAAADAEESGDEVLAGHSYHGEAFNEGPRQQAYLMDGLGRVQFPVTTDLPLAQSFVSQGLAQLHGFWYFEAERSFRQAAAIDPECAMAYWGMAMSNINNRSRSKEFIAQAVSRKEDVTRREQLYIDALNAYLEAEPGKRKERGENYIKALENLIYEFPDDIEARALLALQLWKNRSSGIPITSYLAVDAVLDQVFAVEPMHPAHHYRIHLWDTKRAQMALESSARCGQSLPAIAHMWHMPGHIYSRLKRYDDAVWQQEASARVDHAHMMRDRILPDQIHNFAHNNEWLIRNLNHIGRVQDAVDLAKNMIELPRHPNHNTVKRGSSFYGRTRLFETLSRYERWDDLIALCDGPYLEPTDNDGEQVNRLRYLGRAYLRSGNADGAQEPMSDLRSRLESKTAERDEAVAAAEVEAQEKALDQAKIDELVAAAEAQATEDGGDEEAVAAAGAAAAETARQEQLEAASDDIEKARTGARRRFDSPVRNIQRAIDEFEGMLAVAGGNTEEGIELLKKANGVDTMYLARLRYDAGETEEALEAARNHVNSHRNEVQPLAMLIQLLWHAEDHEGAREQFDRLREISSEIDLDSPVFERLAPISAELGYGDDWRVTEPPADDLGVRPSLDSLGPFRWQPSPAPSWQLPGSDDAPHTLSEYAGRPVVVIFYLGYGCLHCAEQLQAFAPKLEEFREAGIEIVAISTDDREDLQISIDNYEKGDLPIPLLSDAPLNTFRAFGVHDDFEQVPLHGTFLIDGDGMIRWQDISYEPFMDPDFLLEESVRLLSQSEWESDT